MTGVRAIQIACLALGLASAHGGSALAQESDRSNELTIGVGAAVIPSYEGSNDYNVIPGGLVRGKVAGFPFFARGTNLHVDLVRDNGIKGWDLEAGPVFGARLNRTGRIGDARVKALGKLDTAWELGGWAGIAKTGVITSDYDNLSFRVAYVADVGSAHKSYIVTPAVEYATPLSETTLVGFSLSADYVGKGYGNYYYDIALAGSQASGLGVYAAAGDKAGFAKLNVGMVAAKSLSGDLRKGWALFGLAGYGRLLGRYADSPIVKDAGNRNQWMGGLGVAYTF
ncbi:MAG: MipA/OmpV family protein [Sphingobium sp.]